MRRQEAGGRSRREVTARRGSTSPRKKEGGTREEGGRRGGAGRINACRALPLYTSVTRARAHTVLGEACGLSCVRSHFASTECSVDETVHSVDTECLLLGATPG